MRNRNLTIVTIFTDLYVTITKILELKARLGGGVVKELICWNALMVKNN